MLVIKLLLNSLENLSHLLLAEDATEAPPSTPDLLSLASVTILTIN